ncbi:hypothetical protein [Streptomyces sp. NPDC014006]|uniref:hypothetical protein n=1 Tax=Streptomyces sp. NPDC014006 TaxID=3364870 RepID=UPI0036FFA640
MNENEYWLHVMILSPMPSEPRPSWPTAERSAGAVAMSWYRRSGRSSSHSPEQLLSSSDRLLLTLSRATGELDARLQMTTSSIELMEHGAPTLVCLPVVAAAILRERRGDGGEELAAPPSPDGGRSILRLVRCLRQHPMTPDPRNGTQQDFHRVPQTGDQKQPLSLFFNLRPALAWWLAGLSMSGQA